MKMHIRMRVHTPFSWYPKTGQPLFLLDKKKNGLDFLSHVQGNVAHLPKKPERYLRKPMMAHVEIISWVPSSAINYEDLDTIDPRWTPNAFNFARQCYACQILRVFIHQAPGHLHSTKATWPFEAWGMDIIGPINPPSSRGHRFSLAITDNFFKWAEVVPLKEVLGFWCGTICQTPCQIMLWSAKRIAHDNGQ